MLIVSEALTELQPIKPLRDAQLLALACIQHLVETPQIAEPGYCESAYYFAPDVSNQTRRLYIIASITNKPGFALTHLLSIHEPTQVGSIVDVGKIIEAISIEPVTGESVYTNTEEPGQTCDDSKVIGFIANYGVLPLIARLHVAQNEALATSITGE